MSTTAIDCQRSQTLLDVLAYRAGNALLQWSARPRTRRSATLGVDVRRLAQAEDRRADARFAEPLGLHHWIR